MPSTTALYTAAGNGTSRRGLLEDLDTALRETFALLEDARRRGLDMRDLCYRQELAKEGLCRFLAGDDARAQDLLDQLSPPEVIAEAL